MIAHPILMIVGELSIAMQFAQCDSHSIEGSHLHPQPV